jgi:diguanylate cyclase (GGDEF)-like protein
MFWPATGLIAGLLVVAPSRLRLWIMAAVVPGEVIADVIFQGYPVLTAIGWGGANVVEAVLAAWIMLKVARRRLLGNSLRDFAALAVAAIAAPLVGAFGGAAVSVATFGGSFLTAWLNWWSGDGTGMMLVVPLVISLSYRSPRATWTRTLTGLVEVGFVIGAAVAVFALTTQSLEILILPPLALLAVGNGLRLTAVASLSFAIVAAVATGNGGGPLSNLPHVEARATGLQAFITATAFVAFLICATMSERKRAETALEQLATRDPLTGIHNRRRLMADLEQALKHASAANPHWLVMFDLDGFKTYNDTFGHPEGDLVLRRLAGRFAAAIDGHGTGYRLGGDEFCALIAAPVRAIDGVIRGCCEALTENGEAFTIRTSFGKAFIPVEAATPAEALHLADQRMYAHKGSGGLSARKQTLSLALKILEVQQPILGRHSSEVATLARAVGERLGLDDQQLDEIERTAEVHDFGKIAIPHSILNKETALDAEEWCFMKRHTLIGENMLQAAPALGSIAKLVRSTHERFDGAGYPDGLCGDEIPLASRIVFVCDAYDSMTTDRSYRARLDDAAAIKELRGNAATQFDPAIVDAFCDVSGQPHHHSVAARRDLVLAA